MIPQAPVRRKNPYVGPRALRSGEPLPARSQEVIELTDLLIAQRIVLLHAPSGAGKTSLIQAGLIPALQEESIFTDRPFAPTRPLRVNTPVPLGLTVRNRYVFSAAMSLLPNAKGDELVSLSFQEVVERALPASGGHIPVLIFDQFEEILVIDPADWDQQEAFFDEVGSVLGRSSVWALFAMREDYMGGLDRFVHHIPGFLQTTYRLDFLDIEGAMLAIQQPAAQQGVTVTNEAAEQLVTQLRSIRVQSPRGGLEVVQGPYVQPFQLQVVCRNLWKTLGKEFGSFSTINVDQVKTHGDIAKVLRRYYRDAVAEVAEVTGADERIIRDWFETELITVQGFRIQTLTGPPSDGVDSTAVALALQDAYLVRSDSRAGSIWYELAHDQLIAPVLEDNRDWRLLQLEPWQRRARDWQAKRPAELLLTGPELAYARRQQLRLAPTTEELEFLEASERAIRDRTLVQRARQSTVLLGIVILALLVLVVVLLALLVAGWRSG